MTGTALRSVSNLLQSETFVLSIFNVSVDWQLLLVDDLFYMTHTKRSIP